MICAGQCRNGLGEYCFGMAWSGFPKEATPKPFGSPPRRFKITPASTSPRSMRYNPCVRDCVLDENIVDGQRLLLEGWNVTARLVVSM